MCGRFTREFTWRQVHEFLSLPLEFLEAAGAGFAASYNVAPTQASAVCRAGGQGANRARELVSMEWGFRPAWIERSGSPKGGIAPINARCETAATNPVFRAAFRERRCIVPVSGFYEWKRAGDRKIPQYIRVRGEAIMGLAGLWEPGGRGSGGDAPPTFTILTTRANAFMAEIHDRMPVILERDRLEEWLVAGVPGEGVFEPLAPDRLEAHAVSTRVNSPRNNDPSLVKAVEREGLFE